MKQRNIFVTGASGFIGRHFCLAAIEKGHRVFAMIRNNTPETQQLEQAGVTLLNGNIDNASRMRVLLGNLKTDGINIHAVVHAAGLTKARDREAYFSINYTGTHNLLDAIRDSETSIEKFVFISSLAACGPVRYGEYIDSHHQAPVTDYGESKLMAEMLIRAYPKTPYIILRPTAVYGPGEKDLLTVFRMVNKGLNPVIGFHRQALTFVYVNDLVQLMLASIDAPVKSGTYFVTDGNVYDKYSFGREVAASLNKKPLTLKIPAFISKTAAFFAQSIAGFSGKPSVLNVQKYRELAAGSWNCRPDTTFRELDYTPAFDLKKGIHATTQWYKTNKWIK